jgi:hypothetical protein
VNESLTPEQKHACLDTLGAERLRALLDSLGVEAADRRSRSGMVAALLGAPFSDVLGALRVPELKEIATQLGVYAKVPKDVLVQRILAAKGASVARAPSTAPPASVGSAGALKSSLRMLALDAAAGFKGRDAAPQFARALFACFGWNHGEPPGADIPASLSVLEHGRRVARAVAALWSDRRVLVEAVEPGASLETAWNDLLQVCLQIEPNPQFVVLTNQRDLRLYDLSRDRTTPRLSIPIDDLPKYSDAFPFLGAEWVPGVTPKIVNVGKVSREVADLVARLYRSLKARFPNRDADVIKFTLQCIITMFAEDIGLLPPKHFTNVLYEGARHGDVEKRLRELFDLMARRDVPAPRKIAYFNGGLFTAPVTLHLGEAELAALTKAAEANWTYVDPHIFGSVFQGIMNDAERHATGAHYTAHEDIMRVVGPTIVEPWRKRIREATTLADLLKVRDDLFKFRVLDPACGSGNFLYVAFRELYRLDTEVLARLREFPSAQGPKGNIGWGSGISTSNFYGIDTNRFAVELAKVTLNIAKKIAFEERRQAAAGASAQGELEVDPSLPLDNLDKNIVCADALFTDWPNVDAIVGNPPFTSGTNIRGELGLPYLTKLREAFDAVGGRADYCSYWFRRAHDHLVDGGRAGLVGTSGIRIGNTREASLDYLVANGGTIVNAVSSRVWPGDAAVNVSMVNWVRGAAEGPYELLVEDETFSVERIPTHLQLHADVSGTKTIAANAVGTSEGVNFGHPAFRLSDAEVSALELDRVAAKCIRPVATGDDLLRGRLTSAPDFCVDLRGAKTEDAARAMGGPAFEHLRKHVYPIIRGRAESGKETHHYARRLRVWWQPGEPRHNFWATIQGRSRFLVCPKVSSRPAFAFISTRFVPNNTMRLIAVDDDYSFAIIQSFLHWAWTKAKGGRTRADINYTTEVWDTFPWPQEVSETSVARVAAAGRDLRATRERLMAANGWSLRALHQAAEVDGPHQLKSAQHALDDAVRAAYGMPGDQEVTEFLLELNQCVAEDEEAGRTVTGPGLPPGLAPKDPRWFSDDCIEPPPLPE